MDADAPAGSPAARDWFERGSACQRAGDLSGALNAFRTSIRLDPQVAAPWIGLSQVLDANGQLEDARRCLQEATVADPRSIVARRRLAAAHKNLGHVEEARREYAKALELDPDSAATQFGLGQLLEDLGEPEGAARAYRKALALDPARRDALASLLGLGRHIDVAAEMREARELLAALAPRERALVGYGLGKAHEQRGEQDAAFAAYVAANAARKDSAPPFDRKAFDARITAMIELFPAEFLAPRRHWGDPSERPVFVVGLPRSGTTLTEQILASHPQCFGAGELNVLSDLATGTPDRLAAQEVPWPACAPRLSRAQVQALGAEYCARAGQRAPGSALRVVDKQPLNFWHLGLVAMALPNARIVHCTRDIRDCGLSIFTQNFNVSQTWSTDLGDIAHYWKGYRRLMAHWRNAGGLEVLDVAYEDTVSDLETQGRRLLEFVGLPWDERVMNFHQSERAVQTPSRWQVRQPLYQTSRDRWRAYQRHLAPLIDATQEGQ